jgi:hypothetical protein
MPEPERTDFQVDGNAHPERQRVGSGIRGQTAKATEGLIHGGVRHAPGCDPGPQNRATLCIRTAAGTGARRRTGTVDGPFVATLDRLRQELTHVLARAYGGLEWAIPLPAEVDEFMAQARYGQSVFHLALPKRHRATIRLMKIRAG